MKKQAQPTMAGTPAAQAASGARGAVAQGAQAGRSAAARLTGGASRLGRLAPAALGAAALGTGAYLAGKKLIGKSTAEDTEAQQAKAASVIGESDHVDLIRHFYSVEQGRQVMESLGKTAASPLALVTLRQKMEKVSVADPELMKIALRVVGDGNVLEVYERLGGTFKKEAIGTPMFQPPSMPSVPPMSAPTVPQAPTPKGPSMQPQTPQQQQLQTQRPQGQQGQQTPGDSKIKVQLQSPAPGQQGTSVSVG